MRIAVRPFAVAVPLAGLCLLALAASAASAEVACNRWDECWRVRDRFASYPPDAKIVLHDDKWASHHTGPGWRWLPGRGERGYYRHGVWERF